MSTLQKVEQSDPLREIILGYGPPGSGKTRLFTSLPGRFGKIAYIAIDEGSENLDSVLPQYRERIDVFRPLVEDGNWVQHSAEISYTDWKKKGYDTLVIDTFSNLTRKWLHQITQQGLFQEKRNMVGKPGEPGSIALSDKGHYGGTHGVIRNFITMLFARNPHLNIIFICHETVERSDEGRDLLGGPATVGKAMLNEFPTNFKTVIRVTFEEGGYAKDEKGVTLKPLRKVSKYVARMAPHGAYIARRNENSTEGNTLRELDLDVDPANFWTKYDEGAK